MQFFMMVRGKKRVNTAITRKNLQIDLSFHCFKLLLFNSFT